MILDCYWTATTSHTSHKITLFNSYSFPIWLTLICCTWNTPMCVCEIHLFRTDSHFPYSNSTLKKHLKRRVSQNWQILSNNISKQALFNRRWRVLINYRLYKNTESSTENWAQKHSKMNSLAFPNLIYIICNKFNIYNHMLGMASFNSQTRKTPSE